MDFLQSLSSLALGSPYSKGDALQSDPEFPGIWSIHKGTVRRDGSPCTLFTLQDESKSNNVALAQNAALLLRKLRIPGVLKIIDTYQSGSSTTIATEPCRPLHLALSESGRTMRLWGLKTLLRTLTDLHAHAKCFHCNISRGSIMETASGEWALTGFEIAAIEPNQPLFGAASGLRGVQMPPEGWSVATPSKIDAFQFGALVQEILGDAAPPQIIRSLEAPPGRRSTLESVQRAANKALSSPLDNIADKLTNVRLIAEHDFLDLVGDIRQNASELTTAFCAGKVVPVLADAVMSGKGGINVVAAFLQCAGKLDSSQYETAALPAVIHLFKSLDRQIRMELLGALPVHAPLIPKNALRNSILPSLAAGFADTEPLLRRASVDALIPLAPQLSSRQLNSEVLRLLAARSKDSVPEIRARTTAVLVQLASYLEPNVRSSVLVAALARALGDPDSTCRLTALEGLRQTSEGFGARECAESLLSPVAIAVLDSEHEVAICANSVLDVLLHKIRAEADVPGDANAVAIQNSAVRGAFAKTEMHTHVREGEFERPTKPVPHESFQELAEEERQSSFLKHLEPEDDDDSDDCGADGWDW